MKLLIKRPMLAAPVEVAEIRYPIIAQPKIDGIRCLVQHTQVLTRRLLQVPNLHVREALEDLGQLLGKTVLLDGELVCGTGFDFQATSSGVMSREGTPAWTYLLFDVVDASRGGVKLAYAERLKLVNAVANAVRKTDWHRRHSPDKAPLIAAIDHRWAETEAQLLAYEHTQLELGYEGLCLRDPIGFYKEGRSTVKQRGLLKLKRFVDAEAEVVAVEPYYENHNEATTHKTGGVKRSQAKAGKKAVDLLGCLVVRDVRTKLEFSVGAGFTLGQRKMFWQERDTLIGKLVKYKSQTVGVKTAPRFPVFLGFRHEADA